MENEGASEKMNESRCKDASSAFVFNTRLSTNVFFVFRILKFSKKQCDELNKTYVLPTIRKMRLGDAFPNKSLHARKTELGKG